MAFNKNKAMEAARKYVEKGHNDKAIKEYLKVVQHDPKDVRVWLKIGDLYAKKGAKAEATETYLKVAKFYSEQGFYLKAVAVYKQILKLDPRMVEVNLKLAELYRQLGLLSDAMQHFERVAAHFHREGKTKEALATIRQLVDLDPDNVATRIKLAELYSKEDMTDEAIQEFRHACEYLRSHNRQDDFIKVAERLLWHDAKDIPLNRELATLYLRRNDARRALQKLQVCFKADSRDVETLALLAQAFQALDQKAKTVSVLKELARVFTENGQTEQAMDVHRKILMFAPEDPESREALGEAPSARQPAAPIAPPVATPEPEPAVPQPAPRLQTSDFRAAEPPGGVSPTGSVPLMRDDAGGGDADFVADISVDDESFHARSDEVEANADEIVKILTETDVYVKYGLHQKAIDHLKRVFEVDPQNLEARERLKDILLAMGRENDAIDELLTLADQVASQDPDRAGEYIAQAQNVDAGNPKVVETARRLGIDLGDQDGSGFTPGIEIVDDDEFEIPAEALGNGHVAEVDAPDFAADELEFDDIDFGNAPVETSAPAELEFELDDSYVQPQATPDPRPITQEVALDQVEEVSLDDIADPDDDIEELSFDDVVVEGTNELRVEDLEMLEEDDEPEPADELGLDDAHALSAQPLDAGELELPHEPRIAEPVAPEHLDEPAPAPAPEPPPAGGIEDDLDEADFFVSQSLYGEARDILEGLLGRYPNHPLILAKLQDIAAMESGQTEPDDPGGAPLELPPEEPVEIAAALPAERIEQEIAAGEARDTVQEDKPHVVLEKPVDEGDADTHFDLGLAYKEMGLYDEAVKSFNKVVGAPGREVECHNMIGLCYREQGALAEAVQQFKNGLYVEGITELEKLSLYYEIGYSYELMSDPGEALYFYEMVQKKDPKHRDVSDRVAQLKASGANGRKKKIAAPGADDLDAAFDNAIGGGESDISRH